MAKYKNASGLEFDIDPAKYGEQRLAQHVADGTLTEVKAPAKKTAPKAKS